VSQIAVVGLGHVGLITAACFADLGHDIVGVDVDEARVEMLRRNRVPIYEPGLEELVERGARAGRLSYTSDMAAAIAGAEFVFIAVGTPADGRGDADLTALKAAAAEIGRNLVDHLVVINKSTVPIGTGDLVSEIVSAHRPSDAIAFSVVSNPEFLREGSAVLDFMRPDRVVIGTPDRNAAERVADLYRPLGCPVLITDLHTAEMIKYASNAFLATKISFINEIARICEKLDADVSVVSEALGMDPRIGPAFLSAGIGFGGSCFPKDLRALARAPRGMGYHPELLQAVMDINRDMRKLVVDRLEEMLGGLRGLRIGILGLSYKPNTDDMRDAPALDIIELLLRKGANVHVYDPVAMPAAKHLLNGGVTCARDAYGVARQADAIAVITEWNEFRSLDLGRLKRAMRRPVIVDGRNIWEASQMRELGFVYRGIGRS
jgi:UDPglucose 6-dehydrogenase